MASSASKERRTFESPLGSGERSTEACAAAVERVKSMRRALSSTYVSRRDLPVSKDQPPAYWSTHRDAFHITAAKKAEMDAALGGETLDGGGSFDDVALEDAAAAAAAWERLHHLRLDCGRDRWPEVWKVDREMASRRTLAALEDAMREAVDAASRRRLREAAAPTHPRVRVLVDALTTHATIDADGAHDGSEATRGGASSEKTTHRTTPGRRLRRAGDARVRVGPEAFAATWNDTLPLFDRGDDTDAGDAGGANRRRVTLPEAAALLLKYGVSGVDGKAPVEQLARALLGSAARIVGKLPLLDKRAKGAHGFAAGVDDPTFAGKILYPKTHEGVFAPRDFNPEDVARSSRAPEAVLELEHCYGQGRRGSAKRRNQRSAKRGANPTGRYDGFGSTANNVVFTAAGELVYYAAALGVVCDPVTRRQRFFHGHDGDIKCIALHPNGVWIATGQTGVAPWVCVWDSATCAQLQRLAHPVGTRAVICVAFSRDAGGARLASCGADDAHTIFVWDWKRNASGGNDPETGEPLGAPRPGSGFGPADKIAALENCEQPPGWRDTAAGGELIASIGGKAGVPPNVWGLLWDPVHHGQLLTYGVKHVITVSESASEPGRWAHVVGLFGPGQRVDNVTAALFVPDPCARHRKLTTSADGGQVRFTTGTTRVTESGWVIGPPTDAPAGSGREAILDRQAPGAAGATDTLLLTGFPSGEVGVWVRATPFAARLLLRRIPAHAPGPAHPLPDGSQLPAGVRALVLCEDDATVLSGGADGLVHRWLARQTAPDEEWMAEAGGVGGERPAHNVARVSPWDGRLRIRLLGPASETSGRRRDVESAAPTKAPGGSSPEVGGDAINGDVCALRSPLRGVALGVRGLAVRGIDGTVVIGTDSCELWAVRCPTLARLAGPTEDVRMKAAGTEGGESGSAAGDGDDNPEAVGVSLSPEPITGGHLANVRGVAVHPSKPLFATAAETPTMVVWSATEKLPVAATLVGFVARSVAFSACGAHLSVGGRCGKVRVLVTATLKPLQLLTDAQGTVDCVKYSPDNTVLAVGSHDLVVYLYDTGFRPGRYKVTHREGGGEGDARRLRGGGCPVVNTCWERGLGGRGAYVRFARCVGHSAALSHLDFSLPLVGPTPDLVGRTVLRSSSIPGRESLTFDAQSGRLINANLRDARWATFTSTLGFPVMGIWPDGAGATDVWTACRTSIGGTSDHETDVDKEEDSSRAAVRCVVTGDVFSAVKAFNFPCCADDAPYQECHGHASFVTQVCVTADDRRALSVGGRDRTALQWRILTPPPPAPTS